MSTRNLLNLILLLVIVALVSIVVFEPGKKKPLTPPTLTTLKADDIQHIKISRQTDKSDVELEKTADGWRLVKPFQLPANSFRIDSIFKLLSTVSFSQNNLEKLQPKDFGLDQPYATITFNKQTSIVFGHNKSLKHHRYVKIGSVLHLISDTFYYQLAAKAESFIDHKLLPQKSKIIKLSLANLKIEKIDARWNIKPKPESYSADAVNQLINEWELSQAYDLGFNQKNVKPEARADITVSLANNKTIRFKLKKNKDDFVLLNLDSGVEYFLSAARQDKLLKLPAAESQIPENQSPEQADKTEK